MAVGERQMRKEGTRGWVACDAVAAAVAVCPEGVVAARRCGVAVAWREQGTRGAMSLGEDGQCEVVDSYDMAVYQQLMNAIV